jgi:hypothetical protein
VTSEALTKCVQSLAERTGVAEEMLLAAPFQLIAALSSAIEEADRMRAETDMMRAAAAAAYAERVTS